MPIKIQCGCGQRYAFDAEPVDGRLAVPVNCPVCGVDGTAAANEIIARSLPAPPANSPPPTGTRMRVAVAATPTPVSPQSSPTLPPGASVVARMSMVNREQAEVEARAKVSWGDPPENVLQYLMTHGYDHEEASALIKGMYRERALLVRAKGIKKIVFGILLICAGAAGMLYMLSIKYVDGKLAGLMFGLGLWGLWNIINGGIMVVVPKMQGGDVAES